MICKITRALKIITGNVNYTSVDPLFLESFIAVLLVRYSSQALITINSDNGIVGVRESTAYLSSTLGSIGVLVMELNMKILRSSSFI